jgi:hypothetical protein
MYYLIGLLILLLIYIIIDFLYKYVDCICYQLKLIGKKLEKNLYK